MLRAAPTSTSSPKSSSSAAAIRRKDSLTFVLHPKQLVTLRRRATEILYGDANQPRKAASAILVWLAATSRPRCGRLRCRKSEWHGSVGGLIGKGEEVPMLNPKRREFIALRWRRSAARGQGEASWLSISRPPRRSA